MEYKKNYFTTNLIGVRNITLADFFIEEVTTEMIKERTRRAAFHSKSAKNPFGIADSRAGLKELRSH